MGIPEPQRFDAARFQKRVAFGIVNLPFNKTMLAAVQFNIQIRLQAKEIQIVNANGMLAAPFVAVETAVAQPAPDKFFRPRFVLAKLAGALDIGHHEYLTDDNEMGKAVFFEAGRPSP
jgi:hypothetical protein